MFFLFFFVRKGNEQFIHVATMLCCPMSPPCKVSSVLFWGVLARLDNPYVGAGISFGILLTGFGFYSTSDFLKALYPAHQNKVWNGDFNPAWAGRAVPSTLPCWAACSLPSVPFAVFMSSLGSGDWENTLGSWNWWLSGRTHLHLKHHRWPMRRFVIRYNSSVLQTKWGGHPPALSVPSYLSIRSFSLGTASHHTSPPGTQDLHTLLQLLQSHAFFFSFSFYTQDCTEEENATLQFLNLWILTSQCI